MSKTETSQQLLNFLNKESERNKALLNRDKELFAKQIKKLGKEEIFPTPKKISLWERIKLTIWGN